jgi:hypothetical protein
VGLYRFTRLLHAGVDLHGVAELFRGLDLHSLRSTSYECAGEWFDDWLRIRIENIMYVDIFDDLD